MLKTQVKLQLIVFAKGLLAYLHLVLQYLLLVGLLHFTVINQAVDISNATLFFQAWILGGLAVGGGTIVATAMAQPAFASDMVLHPPKMPWSHNGMFDSLDHNRYCSNLLLLYLYQTFF